MRGLFLFAFRLKLVFSVLFLLLSLLYTLFTSSDLDHALRTFSR